MNYGLPDATIGKIESVLSRHEKVEKAILYGSRAKGTHKRGSDIDLTIVGPDMDGAGLYSRSDRASRGFGV